MRNGSRHLALVFIIGFGMSSRAPLAEAQNKTTSNAAINSWQPTRAVSGGRYVGSKVCLSCHEAEGRSQLSTRMAHTLSAVSDCRVLKMHPRLNARLGHYSYSVLGEGGKATDTVSDGHRSITEILLWAFGEGTGGQSYIWKRGRTFYESRVSYYGQIGRLDLTLGHPAAEPSSLELAEGRPLSEADALRCFSCHATPAGGESRLVLNQLTPGITCEKCHGPGAAHVAAVRRGRLNDLRTFNPGKLEPRDLVYDFCGTYHRNALDVAGDNLSGIVTIRFEPYRLILSRCFDGRAARISCVACHDPHKPLQQSVAFLRLKRTTAEEVMRYRLPFMVQNLKKNEWFNWGPPPPGLQTDGTAVAFNKFGRGQSLYLGVPIFWAMNGRPYWIQDWIPSVMRKLVPNAIAELRPEPFSEYVHGTFFYDESRRFILVQVLNTVELATKGEFRLAPTVVLRLNPEKLKVKGARVVWPKERHLSVVTRDGKIQIVLNNPDRYTALFLKLA